MFAVKEGESHKQKHTSYQVLTRQSALLDGNFARRIKVATTIVIQEAGCTASTQHDNEFS
jgi:hypothetical protein